MDKRIRGRETDKETNGQREREGMGAERKRKLLMWISRIWSENRFN